MNKNLFKKILLPLIAVFFIVFLVYIAKGNRQEANRVVQEAVAEGMQDYTMQDEIMGNNIVQEEMTEAVPETKVQDWAMAENQAEATVLGKENLVKVHFIDTGNSDSILICDNGKYMVIDGAEDRNEKFLIGYYKKLGIHKIDYLVLTHPGEEHVGGLDAIINNFEVGQIFIGGGKSDTKAYQNFLQAVRNKNVDPQVPPLSKTFDLGKGTFAFYNQDADYEDQEDNSLIMLYTFGNTKFLFMGDAGSEPENALPLSDMGRVHVLKVTKHGDSAATSKAFIDAVTPKYSVICCGANSDGYPHNQTLDTLSASGSYILRTDIHGDIVFTSNGHLMEVLATKDPRREFYYENRENDQISITGEAAYEEKTFILGEEESYTVYITETGEKYHRGSCSSLRKSKIAILLGDAKHQGYTPCKICNPPR